MTSVGRQELLSSSLCAAFQRTASVDPEATALRNVGGSSEITWRDYASRVKSIATGLAALGVVAGDTVALMTSNRPEFALVDTAVLHLGAVPYSIYSTNSPEQIAHLLTNAETKVVVCEQRFVEGIKAGEADITTLVVIDGVADGAMTLGDVEQMRNDDFDFEATWRSVSPDDVATLIYTSGTTGPPKGVELTHSNITNQLVALSYSFDVTRGDRFLSFLPSAHIADRMATHYMQIAHGTRVTTLSDPKNIAAALADCKPNYWFAVPRVWEKLKAALEQGFSTTTGLKPRPLMPANARRVSALRRSIVAATPIQKTRSPANSNSVIRRL